MTKKGITETMMRTILEVLGDIDKGYERAGELEIKVQTRMKLSEWPHSTFYGALGKLLDTVNPKIIKFNPGDKKNKACYYLPERKEEAQLSIKKDFNLPGADSIPHQIRMVHTEQLRAFLDEMLQSIPEPIQYSKSVLVEAWKKETTSIKTKKIESSLFFTNCIGYHDPYGKVAYDKWVQLKKEIDAIESKKTKLVEEIRTNLISIFRPEAIGSSPDKMFTTEYLELLTDFVICHAVGKTTSLEDLSFCRDGNFRNHIEVRSRMSYLYSSGKHGTIWLSVPEECPEDFKSGLQEKHHLIQKLISEERFVSKWESIPNTYDQAIKSRAYVLDSIHHLKEIPVVPKICPLLRDGLSI